MGAGAFSITDFQFSVPNSQYAAAARTEAPQGPGAGAGRELRIGKWLLGTVPPVGGIASPSVGSRTKELPDSPAAWTRLAFGVIPGTVYGRAGAFVYRLGHGPLKAERRVRFPYALPIS